MTGPSSNNELVGIIYLSPVANFFLKFRARIKIEIFALKSGQSIIPIFSRGMNIQNNYKIESKN